MGPHPPARTCRALHRGLADGAAAGSPLLRGKCGFRRGTACCARHHSSWGQLGFRRGTALPGCCSTRRRRALAGTVPAPPPHAVPAHTTARIVWPAHAVHCLSYNLGCVPGWVVHQPPWFSFLVFVGARRSQTAAQPVVDAPWPTRFPHDLRMPCPPPACALTPAPPVLQPAMCSLLICAPTYFPLNPNTPCPPAHGVHPRRPARTVPCPWVGGRRRRGQVAPLPGEMWFS